MLRKCGSLVLLAMLAGLLVAAPATAAPRVGGSVSCAVKGTMFTLPKILSTPSPHPLSVRVQPSLFDSLSCDDSGVTGAHITSMELSLTGKLAKGTTCTSLVTDPHFGRTNLKVRWQDTNPSGKPHTVANSSARVTSATWDSGSHAIVMTASVGGAFAGKTMTLQLGIPEFLGDGEPFLDVCNAGVLLGTGFGDFGHVGDHPATISIS